MQTSFNFAWGSVKSDNRVEVGEGVTLLMGTYLALALTRTCVQVTRCIRAEPVDVSWLRRYLPHRANSTTGMPVFPRRRALQAGKLPRSETIQQ